MSLTNPRFASNRRLQAAARNAPAMRRGERDRVAVAALQWALVDYGYPMPRSTRPDGSMDGVFGSETVDAVNWFQRKNGIANRFGNGDGIVGHKTMTQMDQVVPERTFRPPSLGQGAAATGAAAQGMTSPSGLDNRLYDAINIYKHSNAGRGTGYIGGSSEYQARYRRLAGEVLRELWRLWSRRDIAWSPIAVIGNAARRPGPDILVNKRIEPNGDPTEYANDREQGKVAATSCNLVHEATHLVYDPNTLSRFEEELLCRTIQIRYYRELRVGQPYTSRVTGTRLWAMFGPNVAFSSTYEYRDRLYSMQRLVDNVFADRDRRRNYLEQSVTASFIARSLGWWGGLGNRWWSTRGHYLRSLAAQNHDYAEEILQILQSIPNEHYWAKVRTHAGSIDRIRRGLRLATHGGATRTGRQINYTSNFASRVAEVQRKLNVSFGV